MSVVVWGGSSSVEGCPVRETRYRRLAQEWLPVTCQVLASHGVGKSGDGDGHSLMSDAMSFTLGRKTLHTKKFKSGISNA